MGGSAFGPILGLASFPRMPNAVYASLKMRMVPRLQELYEHVAVPAEAPEKKDHGDLDIVVACPKVTQEANQPNVAHTIVQNAVGALYMNPQPGNRTSNYAVPIERGDWSSMKHGEEENKARLAADGGAIFYQESCRDKVDVNVCADKEEFQRVVFFHGYGDLGMIMGLIARNAGLALGEKGLKMPNQPHPPVELSQSFEDIMKFMGWSMDAWKAGFHTKRETFEWAGSTKFFVPQKFRTTGEGITKVKEERKMYAEFVRWAEQLSAAAGPITQDKEAREKERQAFRDHALQYFNKKEEVEAKAHERGQRERLKKRFNGTLVNEMANLGQNWRAVKIIMDEMRLRCGGDAGVLKLYDAEGEDAIRKIVLEVKENFSLTSGRQETASSEVLDVDREVRDPELATVFENFTIEP